MLPGVQAEIKWAGWANIDKRKSYAFAYGVTQPKSQFFIGSKNRVAAGFTGMLYADAETAKIMRIILVAQPPANYAMKNVTYDLTYALSKIGDQQFVVPVKSDFRANEGKTLVWTEVELRRYRKPGAATNSIPASPGCWGSNRLLRRRSVLSRRHPDSGRSH